MNKPVRKVVFPVGGLGTRFLPATKSMPKEMLTVVDKPLIHYAFEEAKEAGIEQFIFVTGRNKTAIDDHFDHSFELESILAEKGKNAELAETQAWMPDAGNIFFTRQQNPLGLGHAVWCARHLVGDEPFAVILADDLIQANTSCLKQMIDARNTSGGNVLAVSDILREKTKSYGIVDTDNKTDTLVKANSLVEKPAPEEAPSTLAIIGRYVLEPEIFDYLEKQQAGSGGEIQLTDAINSMIISHDVFGYRFEGTRFDCGNHIGFVEANIAFALEREDLSSATKHLLKKYAS
jgi:UTP--glucose-1-phosphate uridylyltransferase